MLPRVQNQSKTKSNVTIGYILRALAEAVPSRASTKPGLPCYRASIGLRPENQRRVSEQRQTTGEAASGLNKPKATLFSLQRGRHAATSSTFERRPRRWTDVCRLDANTTANIKDYESFRKLSPTWKTSCDGGVPGWGGSPGARSRSPSNVFLRMGWE